MPQGNIYVVRTRDTGLRLDQCVAKFVISATDSFSPRAQAQLFCQSGKVLVDGKTAKASYRVMPGETITILESSSPILLEIKEIPAMPSIRVVHEDADIVVVDKPAGLSMHPVRRGARGTLVDWIEAKYPEMLTVGENPLRPGIVHRLDKETSGLVVLCRKQVVFEALKTLFQSRKVTKKYQALVFGQMKPKSGSISLALGRVRGSIRRATPLPKRRIAGALRESVTQYRLLTSYPQYSLLSVEPKTGRTHQIRVHLSSIGHSVVGDVLYGSKKERKIAQTIPHQLLHASRIAFRLGDRNYSFSSPLPEHFQEFLYRL